MDQVHLIRLNNGGTELVCEGLFSHPNEIWDLASCPFDQRIFSTVFFNGNPLVFVLFSVIFDLFDYDRACKMFYFSYCLCEHCVNFLGCDC